jgi:hypothetical protein
MEDYLKRQLQMAPFLPFRIVTSAGKSYDVTERNRQMFWVERQCVFIGFLVPETDPCFDRIEVVSILHVVRLEPIPSQQPTGE